MTFGILRLGDAVQRWLRHPEPSSWSHKSTIREKYLYVSCGRTMFAPTAQNPSTANRRNKKTKPLSAFSFAYAGAKEKAIKKKSADTRFRALRSATVAADGSRRLLKKAGENFNLACESFNRWTAKTLLCTQKRQDFSCLFHSELFQRFRN